MPLVTELRVGDQIGEGRIVFLISYLDKQGHRVIMFVTILPDGVYEICRHDSSRTLYDIRVTLKLQKAIKFIMESIKEECKLTHKR